MLIIKDFEGFCQYVENKIADLMAQLETVEAEILSARDLRLINDLLDQSQHIKRDIAKLTMSQHVAVMVFQPYRAMN